MSTTRVHLRVSLTVTTKIYVDDGRFNLDAVAQDVLQALTTDEAFPGCHVKVVAEPPRIAAVKRPPGRESRMPEGA